MWEWKEEEERWMCKNVSRKTMCIPNAGWPPSVRLGIPIERLSIPPGIG